MNGGHPVARLDSRGFGLFGNGEVQDCAETGIARVSTVLEAIGFATDCHRLRPQGSITLHRLYLTRQQDSSVSEVTTAAGSLEAVGDDRTMVS